MLRKNSGLIWLWVSLIVIGIDRFSKYFVLHHFDYHEPFYVFPFLNITLSFNTGAAFSFLQKAAGWQNVVLGSIAVIVSLILIRWLMSISKHDIWQCLALCFILGGALGNVSDRILYGHVIDFISVHWHESWYFAIFNIADSAICVGAFILVFHWFFCRET